MKRPQQFTQRDARRVLQLIGEPLPAIEGQPVEFWCQPASYGWRLNVAVSAVMPDGVKHRWGCYAAFDDKDEARAAQVRDWYAKARSHDEFLQQFAAYAEGVLVTRVKLKRKELEP